MEPDHGGRRPRWYVCALRNLRLTIDRRDDVVSLRAAGELDMHEVDAFEAELETYEAQQPSLILLDLSQVSLIDSHGLSALLDAETRARLAGRRLVLVPPPDAVMQVFRITLLDRRFEWLEGGAGAAELHGPLGEAVDRLRNLGEDLGA